MTTTTDVLDDIISALEPADVPIEYIVSARITDRNGDDHVVKGEELARMMREPERFQITEARVVLNVRKLRKAIIEEVNSLYERVNDLYNEAADKK